MTDRGGAVDVARVCPFVALDDDRDRRLDQPDHRHRCYAESPPAPRAIAHQEAFCLSASFPGCPVFQDWARREAASPTRRGSVPVAAASDVVAGERADEREREPTVPPPTAADAMIAAGSAAAAGAAATSPPVGGSDVEAVPSGPWDAWTSDDEPDGVDPAAIPGRRPQRRDWAAPPPWAGSPSDAPGAAAHDASGGRSGDATPTPPPFLADREPPTPSAAPPEAGGWSPDEPWPDDAGGRGSRSAAGSAWVGGAAAAAGAGLAASSAGRAAAGEPEDERYEDLGPDDGSVPTSPAARRRSIAAGRLREAESDAPPWEPRRRSEAYPTLRPPMQIPRLGPLALAVIALVIAALALFFIVPSLLVGNPGGGGGAGGGGAATATPTAGSGSATPAVSPSPAAPTPQVYVVKQGDTLSRIAKKFGVSVEEIMAANHIDNPDKIALGQHLIIPAAGASVPAGSEAASPGASG